MNFLLFLPVRSDLYKTGLPEVMIIITTKSNKGIANKNKQKTENTISNIRLYNAYLNNFIVNIYNSEGYYEYINNLKRSAINDGQVLG